ncbi:MAG: 50S ribosomal protein L11 methyltransferase [Steroidobacteraceae bacterium]
MSAFLQIEFELGSLDVGKAEGLCVQCGAGAVTFVDARDDPVLEPLPGEFRLWPATRVRALFAQVIDQEAVVRALSAALNISPAGVRAEWIEDRVWEREWLRDFHAMRFGRRLWVCPHHEQVSERGAVVVRMDPGLAFGTGTHPTTALCLAWLDRHVAPGQRVIDYGCGSGILAVAAVMLGAATAHCFDIDPQALVATGENARANGVQACVCVCQSTDALPQGVDVLLANILSGPLCDLVPTFGSLVRPGGSIVLAGLLETEAPDVTQAYGAWFDIRPFEIREGWVGLSGTRHERAPRN